jgi:hypothetical protein
MARPKVDEDQEGIYLVSKDGEIVSREPSLTQVLEHVEELEAQLADIERERRGERARTRLLLARIEDNRLNYDRRDEVRSVFDEWRERCGHKNARLTADRFDAVRSLLEVKRPAPYPRAAFSAAIAGAQYDPYTVQRKNGGVKKFDDLSLICRDGAHFEDFIQRRPKENTGDGSHT